MRLDGWKAIAAHFGRERSTVIRWATERGLPVHRIPGPGRGSVYALSGELDAWLEADRQGQAGGIPAQAQAAAPVPLETPAAEPAPAAAPSGSLAAFARAHRFALIAPLVLALASLSAWAINRESKTDAVAALPTDPALADLYIQARTEWAERTPHSIASGIDKLQRIVAAEPGFAPAYAALADSYILSREFGTLSDVEAFARAQSAVDAALRIDPGNADALRDQGFIAYWWRGDRRAAARHFRQAIAAEPDAMQSHFWFGNALVDNGDFALGMSELERARLLDPALLSLQVDMAWARWSAGEVERGQRELEAIRARNPQLASVHDCLAVIYLAQGDVAGYVASFAAETRIRKLARESAFAARLEAALARDPALVLPLVEARLAADLASGARTSLPWPVFVASARQDRARVMALLEMGLARGETWGSAGLLRQVRQVWDGDRQVIGLLDRLKAPSMTAN